jgi:hypothetical protein
MPSTVDLVATDVSGQKVVNVRETPCDATVGELVKGLLSSMSLPTNHKYTAVLDREGRRLSASETVGDALQADDRIVLTPEVHAGTVT